MFWLYPVVPPYYYAPTYAPVLEERFMPFRQNEQVQIQPYLQTWPYSNTYYGNYYES